MKRGYIILKSVPLSPAAWDNGTWRLFYTGENGVFTGRVLRQRRGKGREERGNGGGVREGRGSEGREESEQREEE